MYSMPPGFSGPSTLWNTLLPFQIPQEEMMRFGTNATIEHSLGIGHAFISGDSGADVNPYGAGVYSMPTDPWLQQMGYPPSAAYAINHNPYGHFSAATGPAGGFAQANEMGTLAYGQGYALWKSPLSMTGVIIDAAGNAPMPWMR